MGIFSPNIYLREVLPLKEIWSEEHLLVRHAVLLGRLDEGLNILHQHEGRAL